MNLTELKENWQDTPEYHKHIHELFTQLVNNDPILKKHRDYVEQNIWGFGERSFWWMWKLILDELQEQAKLLEIGVFRAATLSFWRILKPDAGIIGVTPLDTSGDVWESNYADDIWKIHEDFDIEQPTIVAYRSESDSALKIVRACSNNYDCVYIDGLHTHEGALIDLKNYAPMVRSGGFLVIDDCCCDMHMPFGYFQGIETVNSAFDEWDKSDFEFVFNCVHLRVMRKK